MKATLNQQRSILSESISPSHGIWTALRLSGPVDASVLERSFSLLQHKNPVLRSRVSTTDGEMALQPTGEIAPLRRVDLRNASPTPQAAARQVARESDRPFALDREPLLRGMLLRISDREWWLLIQAHAVVLDRPAELNRQLWSLYEDIRAGETPDAGPDVRFEEFLDWQLGICQGSVGSQQVAYWLEQLAGLDEGLSLPTDAVRATSAEIWLPAERHRFTIDKSLRNTLTVAARKYNTTLESTLLASWQALLHRLGDTSDLAVAVSHRDPSWPGADGIGPLENTVVIRSSSGLTSAFSEHCRATQQALREGKENGDVPFALVLDEVSPDRSLDHAPLAQVAFSFRNDSDTPTVKDLEIEAMDAPIPPVAAFDIDLRVADTGNHLSAEFLYRSSLFKSASIERLERHFLQMLTAIAGGFDVPLGRIPLAVDRPTTLGIPQRSEHIEWSREDSCNGVLPRIREMARRQPHAVAVESETESWTYSDLIKRVDEVADLVGGAAESRTVGVLVGHDARMVSTVLGVIAAGARYVPLDPSYPEERSRYCLQDSGATLVLSDPRYQDLAFRLAESIATVRILGAAPDAEVERREALDPEPTADAYILYTSGSTGAPKGVLQNHRNLAHHARTYARRLQLSPGDRVSQIASLCFDASIMDLFGSLCAGSTLRLVDIKGEGINELVPTLERAEISVFHATPTVFRHAFRDAEPSRLSGIRAVVLGGEEATADDLELFRHCFADSAFLVNGLGPTESTMALQCVFGADSVLGSRTLPIGEAVDDTEVLLIDDEGNEVPAFSTGEIAICSAHVALGYLGLDELTRERFLTLKGGERMYRTGDLGRRRPDGLLEYRGRSDRQVKVRGHRIEIGEIESRLAMHDLVRQTAVAASAAAGGDGGPALVAYVVAEGSAQKPAATLRAYLRRVVPEYMVPARFVFLESLPQTPSGKIDYRALDSAPGISDDAPTAASTSDTENSLASLWCDVLEIDSVGVDDDFFDLGGHSLSAARLIARIRDTMGVELSIRDFFELGTLSEFAARIDQLAAGASAHTRIELEPSEPTGQPSFPQRQLWFMEYLLAGRPVYNNSCVVELKGEVQIDALARAFQDVLQRHETLRTCFVEADGTCRVVETSEPIAMEVTEVDTLEAADALAKELGEQSFDVQSGPLVRLTLISCGVAGHRLHLSIHHIISDEWSTGLFFEELAACYSARVKGEEPSHPNLRLQYSDFANWQARSHEAGQLEESLDFWKEALAGSLPDLRVPTDHPRPKLPSFAGSRSSIAIDRELYDKLIRLSREHKTTLFVVLLSGLDILFHRWGGQKDILVGVPVSVRDDVDLEPLIGFLVNTVVLRTDLSGDPTIAEVIERNRSTMLDVDRHRHVPFERVVEAVNPVRDLSRSPIVQATLSLKNTPDRAPSFAGLEATPLKNLPTGTSKYDLDFELVEESGALTGYIEYSTDLFEAPTIERLVEQYQAVLRAMVQSESTSVSGLPIASEFLAARAEGPSITEPMASQGQLVAYYVPSDSSSPPTTEELRAHLSATLPDYMVPTHFVAIDAIPTTTSGKVDKAALPEPPVAVRDTIESDYEEPRNETERTLAKIWEEILHVDRVGRNDNYFLLGGDSIRGIQVLAKARAAGLELSVGQLFASQTLAELAEHASSASETEVERVESFELISQEDRDKLPRGVEDAYPLSRLQAGMIFHRELEKDSAIYIYVTALDLRIPFEKSLLRRALGRIARRHPVLRTGFELRGFSEPLQLVYEDVEIPLEVRDLRSMSDAEQKEELARAIHEEQHRRRPIGRAPLTRVIAFRLSDEIVRLCFSEHHAILDGWSVASRVTELLEDYVALLRGEEPPQRAPLSASFRDYVALERRAQSTDESRLFWREHLADAPEGALPRPRADEADTAIEVEIPIPTELSRKVMRLVREVNVPLKDVGLAAHIRVLGLLYGQNRVTTGYVTNGRPEVMDSDRVLGLFLNTLPISVNFAELTWEQLLRTCFDLDVALQPHRRYPFDRIQKDVGREDLIDAIYNPVHFHVYNRLERFEELEILNNQTFGYTNFPLNVNFGQSASNSEIRLSVEGRVGRELLERIGAYFLSTLEAMTNSPEQPIRECELLPLKERNELFSWGSARIRGEVDPRSIHQRFQDIARQYPDSIAVSDPQREGLTYRQLDRRSNALAHELRRHGVGPNARVALCLERTQSMIEAIYGTLKAGGGYVPLDPSYPPERLEYMIQDAGAEVLVTERSVEQTAQELVSKVSTQLIYVDDLVDERDSAPENSYIGPEQLAYIIYTSGSTGQPKGVRISHRNVTRLFDATTHWFNFGPSHVATLFHSYAFDFSVFETFSVTLFGGRLVVVPWETTREPEAFYELLKREKVTLLCQTPAAFRQLLPVDVARGGDKLDSLKFVVFGGEALEIESLRPWLEKYGDSSPKLINMYGITETTVHVTYREITVDDLELPGSPIGRPIPDLDIYVLDENLHLAPVGVPGELFVGGSGPALGYHERPELTGERFLPDHFRGSGKMYRSGDLVRWSKERELEYLGRVDDQVKIRGFRIEPGEIEGVLRTHQSISDVIVHPIEDDLGKRLVAYFIVDSGAEEPEPGELTAFLDERLPSHMLPAHFVRLDSFPMTPSGKVAKNALPSPSRIRADLGDDFEEPVTPQERMLARILESTLMVDRVGRNDTYRNLGGDSILGLRVVAEARAEGLDVSMSELLSSRPLKDLAAAAAETAGRGSLHTTTEPFDLIGERDRIRVPPDVVDAYPLSRLQAGMFFHSELAPDSGVYMDVTSAVLRAAFDPDAMRAALDEIARRHPMLRTSIDLSNYTQPLQLVHRRAEIPLLQHDLRQMTAAEQKVWLAAWLEREKTTTSFEWTRPPLIRITVHRLSDEEFRLNWTEHHVTIDGWSIATMVTETIECYAAALRGEELGGAHSAAPYREFVALELQALEDEALRSFWREKLQGASLLELPGWQLGGGAGEEELISHDEHFSADLSRKLVETAEELGLPIKSLLLAAHLRVLSFLGSQRDVVTGFLTHGRPEIEHSEKTLGLFLNNIPLRVFVGDVSWAQLAQRAYDAELEILPHRRFPLSEIQNDLGSGDLFEVYFNFVRFHVYDRLDAIDDLEVLSNQQFGLTNFPLVVDFAQSHDGKQLSLSLAASSRRFTNEQVEHIGAFFTRALQAIAFSPHSKFRGDDLLGREGRVLEDWNDTSVIHPFESVVSRFNRVAAAKPDEIACSDAYDRALTYQQLDRRSNQIARALSESGARPGDRVGIFLRRTTDMLATILAVFKAGAAYVPLDPTFPESRLGFLVDDADLAAVVFEDEVADALPSGVRSRVNLSALSAEADAKPLPTRTSADQLAYILHTSGSTGTPKGVMVPHGCLHNFLASMDSVIGEVSTESKWLAVTSISFDISVLELLWPLRHGIPVVIAPEQIEAVDSGATTGVARTESVDFGLFYFAADSAAGGDCYRLLKAGARFADENGLTAIWTPERHFHRFGGLYPNPAVTGAAVAAMTERVHIRSGSCVLPLHHPVRVAEEWSVVDNLSGGRVGLALASGWNVNDFSIRPEAYADRKKRLFDELEVVKALWRGEEITLKSGDGKPALVKLFPPPVQSELPIWITSGGHPHTWQSAGQLGANILSHLLGQDLATIGERVALYRKARQDAGFDPDTGNVTLMLHTFVGEDLDAVRETCRPAFTAYLEAFLGLAQLSRSLGSTEDLASMTEEDKAALLDHAFERYFQTSALLGTPAKCNDLVEQLMTVGVNEVACLIDFGIETDAVIESLPYMAELQQRFGAQRPQGRRRRALTLAELLKRERPTHLQCTPPLASILLEDVAAAPHLDCLSTWLVGGQAFPTGLAAEIRKQSSARIINMYGPTETTIWSTFHEVDESESQVPIGKPIDNTFVYVLDDELQRVPIGSVGELYIGGLGVAAGYWRRPELTSERFLADPYCLRTGARMYRTGDYARFLPDGNLVFLGRADNQVKIRGHRIELGEIEDCLSKHPEVQLVAVDAWAASPSSERQLVAYTVSRTGESIKPKELREHLSQELPDYMIPALWVHVDQMPMTPNGKIDRKALPAPNAIEQSDAEHVEPRTASERLVATLMAEVLDRKRISAEAHFFEHGGNSLLATRLVARIRARLGTPISLRAIFENPVVSDLARQIDQSAGTKTDKSVASSARIESIPRTGEIPTSFSQTRMWFLANMADVLGAPHWIYTVPLVIRLEGDLDVEALERSASTIIERHESLRTRFREVDGRCSAFIVEAEPAEIPVTDLRALSRDEAEEEARRLVQEVIEIPFDLTRGPLLRLNLVRISENEHLLITTLHHIVSDGWSTDVFFRELASLYESYRKGWPNPLPPFRVQYADYAHWQRRNVTPQVLENQLDYWKNKLRAPLAVLDMPTDRPRPEALSYRGARYYFSIEESDTTRLEELSLNNGVTLFMTIIASFNVLLHRWSDQDDIAIGTPIAGRRHVDIEGLIGFFLNTLVLRSDLSGDLSFEDLLAQVRETVLDAQDNQDVPFEMLVEAVNPKRSLRHTPLFQAMCVLQNEPNTAQLEGLIISNAQPDTGTSQYDLTLSLEREDSCLTGYFEYSTDLFDEATVGRLVKQFQLLVHNVLKSPKEKISRIGLIPEEEKQQLLSWGRARLPEPPRREAIHQRFSAIAAEYPDAVAISDPRGESLTYRQLDRRSNALAIELRELGVRANERVALCLERSPRIVEAIYGTLKAGGGYVPVDPAYPLHRLEYTIQDSGATVLIAEKESAETVEKLRAKVDVPVLYIDEHDAESDQAPADAYVGPEQLAYIIYTSGSTGQPKGVRISHRNVTRLFDSTHDWFRFGPDSVLSLFHSYAFDVSVFEIFGATLFGGRVVVVPKSVTRDPNAFYKQLKDERVTLLSQTPSAFRQLLTVDAAQGSKLEDLRFVVFAGEALELESLRPWIEKYGDRSPKLVNMYGITETTVHSTYREVRAEDLESSSSPIGIPIPDLDIYILDDDLALVPIGIPGELCVGGQGPALGYHNRPELTAERFVQDPIRGEGVIYRSGDLARWNADGELEYLGRIDDQVKIRGFRIEPGEIEGALRPHPSIADVIVHPYEDDRGKQLVAYLIASRDATSRPTTSALREFLSGTLPEHMVPSHFVTLDEFPMTPSGKVAKNALPPPSRERDDLGAEFEEPLTPSERYLAGIWKEVLKVDRVGRHDNFFDLGGNSFLAIQVAARARKKLGVELDLAAFFQIGVLAGIAVELDATDEGQERNERLAEIMDWVMGLSEEEVVHQLALRGAI